MIGRIVSHYRILGTLGSGGMGVVYLAQDERLGRQVALKFLPPAWSREGRALERFRVEARAASALSHPGICAIYDIGEDGDTPFIVMEALRGETLRERISKGPMRVGEVLDIGIQLTDALEAAHAHGIVHRDIKPANIFLGEKNRVRVLDFGLAKLTSTPAAGSSGADTTSPPIDRVPDHQITMPGTALGTVSYMSPEQARGEDIDSRTDLFSLGAVLYEMVTGIQAFGGSTTAVVYDAILNRAPRPIAQLNPLVPSRLETVILTALEKDRDLRYQHASDIEAELKRIRRDIDTLSTVTSQPGIVPVRESTPALVNTSVQAAPSATRWRERTAVVVAIVAAVLAGVWIWRGQPLSVEPGRQPSPSAQVAAPTEPPAPAPTTPPVDPSRAPAPTPTVETESARTSPPQQRLQTTTPVDATRETRRSPPMAAPSSPAPASAEPAAGQQAGRTEPSSAPAVTPPPATTLPPSPRATNETSEAQQPAPALSPVVVDPNPPPPAATVTPPPARTVAPSEPASPAPSPQPPAAAVETDEAAIGRVIRTYEQAIETKDIVLFRSVRPGLTPQSETIIRNSFRQIDSQEIDIHVDSLNVSGRTATARITRRDTLVSGGRRRTETSSQTLRFERAARGWVISE